MKLKNILTSSGIISALVLSAQTKPKPFSISAEINGLKDEQYVFLFHKWEDKLEVDSVKVKNNKFSFKGSIAEPNMYWLVPNKGSQAMLIFFAEKGSISIKGKLDSIADARVSAGNAQKDYNEYRMILKKFDIKKFTLSSDFKKAQEKGDMALMQSLQNEYQSLEGLMSNEIKKFISEHPKSPVSGYCIWAHFNQYGNIAEIDALYNGLDKSVKETKFGKLAKERLNSLKGSTVGFEATDFVQNDVNDKPVKLSSFKGKYVLVDFWASWCGPCRAENPNVVAAYKAFHDKGFDILGVSLDSAKDKWLKAIEKDGLTWTHVSDL